MRQFYIDRAAIPHRKIGVRKWRLPRCAEVPDGGAWLAQAGQRVARACGASGASGASGGSMDGLEGELGEGSGDHGGLMPTRCMGGPCPGSTGVSSGEGGGHSTLHPQVLTHAVPTRWWNDRRESEKMKSVGRSTPRDGGMAGMKKPALSGLSAGCEGRSGEGRAPQLAAVLVNRLDQHRDMLGRRELRDAMSQVEDVAPTRVGRTVAVQRADDLFTHLFG